MNLCIPFFEQQQKLTPPEPFIAVKREETRIFFFLFPWGLGCISVYLSIMENVTELE